MCVCKGLKITVKTRTQLQIGFVRLVTSTKLRSKYFAIVRKLETSPKSLVAYSDVGALLFSCEEQIRKI
jgi:hypothetical protein